MSGKSTSRRNICENRRARRNYEVIDTLEVGISLLGSEVKSLRAGRGNLAEAYVRFEAGQAWLCEAHISQYAQAGPHNNHEPTRRRPLLMHQLQIIKWSKRVAEKGLTVIPLRMYFSGAWVKLEIGLGRGRKLHDKRKVLKERASRRDTERALRGR